MKKTWLLSSFLALVLIATLVISACAPTQAPAPTQPTQPAPTPTAPAPTATAPAPTTQPAPPPAAEVIKWRYADIYARESAYSLATIAFIDAVEAMTDGQIKITYYATGELMAAGEIFDGVTKGMIEAAPAGMGYAVGAIGRVQHLDCGGSAYLSPQNAYGMIYDKYGEFTDYYKTVQKYYGAAGVYPMPLYFGDGVDWVYSTQPLSGASDLIGLPFRTSGVSSEILQLLGAATVWLPWEELYTALQMGTVKAAEWAGPDLMFGMGLQEVAKYWYLPAFWSSYTESRLINLKAWDKLSPAQQAIVHHAGQSTWLLTQATADKLDVIALQRAQDEAGVQIGYWNDADMALFKNAWKQLMENIGTSGEPYTAEMYKMIKDYRVSINQWPD